MAPKKAAPAKDKKVDKKEATEVPAVKPQDASADFEAGVMFNKYVGTLPFNFSQLLFQYLNFPIVFRIQYLIGTINLKPELSPPKILS